MNRETVGISGMFDTLLQLRPVQIFMAVLLILSSAYMFTIGSVIVPTVFGCIGFGILGHHWRKYQKSKGSEE